MKLYFNYLKILSFYLFLEKFLINSLFKWGIVLNFKFRNIIESKGICLWIKKMN